MSTTPVTVTAYGSYIDLQKHASGTPPETSGSIYLSGAAASEMVYISTTASLPVLLITGSTGLANGSVKVSAILDEDDMTSNAAGALATQQSIKAYVDAQLTAQDLDFQGDSGGALAIDLDSETLTIAGGDGLASAGSGNTLTMNVDITNQAAATGVNNSDTILIDDGDGGTIRKMTRAHFLGSAAADFTNGATATTVSGSGQLSGMKLIIDTDGFIGTAGDTNLLQLENDELKINGSAHAVAGELSASTTVSGRSFVVDNGKTIGCAADTNLMTLTANTLTVAGATVSTTISGSGQISGMKLILDEDGVIGTSADADLLTLEANELKVAGAVHATAGEVSASTTVKGRDIVIDTGKTIGIAADTDLLTLTANTVTVAGAVVATTTVSGAGAVAGLSLQSDTTLVAGTTISGSTTISGRSLVVDNGSTIGCAADTNLMTLTANTLTVAGATVSTTISGSGQISGMKLILDEDGVIGTSADADLLTLEANELKVAGAVHATAGEVSASTTVSGRSVVVDTGFTVGCAADTDLLTLGNAALTAKGTVTVGASTAGHDVTFYGTNANDLMLWDASENAIIIKDGNSETVRMGGDATSAYAVDVQDGSNAINKIRAAAFVTYSDERLKSDVKPMRNALKTVNSLKAVNFTWKKDGVQDFGFLAQDLKKAVPQAVHGTEDGLYGVDYGRLTSILVSAIQEQSIQIEMLKAKLDK